MYIRIQGEIQPFEDVETITIKENFWPFSEDDANGVPTKPAITTKSTQWIILIIFIIMVILLIYLLWRVYGKPMMNSRSRSRRSSRSRY